jgi:hypothetical protein
LIWRMKPDYHLSDPFCPSCPNPLWPWTPSRVTFGRPSPVLPGLQLPFPEAAELPLVMVVHLRASPSPITPSHRGVTGEAVQVVPGLRRGIAVATSYGVGRNPPTSPRVAKRGAGRCSLSSAPLAHPLSGCIRQDTPVIRAGYRKKLFNSCDCISFDFVE